LKYCALTPMVTILTMERKTFVMSAMLQLSFCVNCWIHTGRTQFATLIMNERLDVAQLEEGRGISNNVVLNCDLCASCAVYYPDQQMYNTHTNTHTHTHIYIT
jgi:hypothetical protein